MRIGEIMRKGARLKTCKRGHLRIPENLTGKRRHCRLCDIARTKVRDSKPEIKAAKKAHNHSPEGRAYQKIHNLKRLGWTVEMWRQTLLEQGNVCASCRGSFTENDKPCADHDHINPPEPRGIIHSSCNKAIGMLRESPEKCRAAAEYLESWGK